MNHYNNVRDFYNFEQNLMFTVQNTPYRRLKIKKRFNHIPFRPFHQTCRIIRYKYASLLRIKIAFFAIYIAVFAILIKKCDIIIKKERKC